MLVMALSNMLHAEEVFVRTAVGGGRERPLEDRHVAGHHRLPAGED